MRSMKKLLSSLLIAVLCMAVIAVPVYAEGENEAKIGDTEYATLADAVAVGGEITLLKDVSASEVIQLAKNVTIIGNGYTVTSSATRVFRVTVGGISVNMQGVNIVSTAGSGDTRGVSIDGGMTGVQLTLSNCSISGASYAVNVVESASATIVISGGSYSGLHPINIKAGAASTITISGATINVTYPASTKWYGCGVCLEGNGHNLNVNGTTFSGNSAVAIYEQTPNGNTITVDAISDNTSATTVQVVGSYYYGSLKNTVEIGGNLKLTNSITVSENVTVPDGKSVCLDLNGKTLTIAEGGSISGSFTVVNGYVASEPSASWIPEGYAAVLIDGMYYVHQHNPVLVEAKDPTCTAEGNEEHYFCSACGLYYECVQNAAGENVPGEALSRDQIYSAPVHATKLVEEKAPTCTELGVMEHYECINCSKLFWDEEGNDEITDVNSVNIAYAPHTTTKHDATPSTCINYGTIEYYECNVCHKCFSDEACTTEVNSTVSPSLGSHTTKEVPAVEATCNAPGNLKYYVCEVCQAPFLDAAGTQPTSVEAVRTFVGHTVTLVEAVEPTLEKDGNIAYEECLVCGQFFDPNSGNLLAKEDVIIPKLVPATAIEMTSAKFEIEELVGVLVINPNSYYDDFSIGIKTTPANAYIGDITVTVADAKIAQYTRYEWESGTSHQIMGITPGTTTVTVKTETGLTTTFELAVKALTKLTVGTAEKYEVPANYNAAFSFAPKADGKYIVNIDKFVDGMSMDLYDITSGPVEASKAENKDGKMSVEFELKKGKTYIVMIQDLAGTAKSGTIDVAMLSHTHNLTKTAAVASTCKEQGTVEHYTCAACSKIFADAQAKTEITDTKAALAAHTLTKVAAKDATYTDAGNVEYYSCSVCSKLFSDAEAKTETTLEKVTVPQMIEVVGSKAEVSEEAMDAAIEAAGTAGNVTLDLTKDEVVGEETAAVSSAVIPVASLEKVADAGASLTLTKADATVTMDAKALESIAKAAGTGTVTLVVQEVKTEELAVVQQNAVKDKKVAAVISAELINTATNENIGTEADGGFGGGTVTVQIPFTPEEGYKGTDYTVFYVADNGAVTEIKTEYKDGCLVVALNHFSEYVVVNTSYVKPSTGTNPATGDYGMVMPLAIMLLCGVAAAGLIIGKKKYNF